MAKTKNPAKKQRAPIETPLPSIWGRSKTGTTYFEIVQCTKRNELMEKVYRLNFFFFYRDGRAAFVEGNGRWTKEQLLESGMTFLKNKPTKAMIEKVS